MKVTHFGSGSSGNAYLAGKTLIDCGLDMDYSQIEFNRVLITHAHIDHIRHLYHVLKQTETWFAPQEVYDSILHKITKHPRYKETALLMEHKYKKPRIKYFRLNHDVPCYGYVLGDYVHLGDTGYPDTSLIPKGKRLYTIESNYDTETLDSLPRPDWLKERIKETHLSNELAWELAKELKAQHVIYVHLSREANSPKLARITHKLLGAVGDYPEGIKVYDTANLAGYNTT